MTVYVPGTLETDPKKVIMSLQQIGPGLDTANANIATNTANISTNTANIATNTSNIASNTSAITSLQNGPLTSGNVAAKSDQTAATSVNLAVTPGRQQYHPSAVKAWVKFTGSTTNGNQTIGDSFNVTSVSRTGAGTYTVTFTTAFTTTNYVCVGSSHGAGSVNAFVQFGTLTTGSVNAGFINISGPAAYDPTLGASLMFVGTE